MAQGTIKDFDERDRSGSLLMDDRREVAIDAESTVGSVVRTLRIGQRVRFDLEDVGGATVARRLRLVTFD